MNRSSYAVFASLLICFLLFSLTGCGEKSKGPEELAVGNWIQYRNRTYILLILNPKGTWSSSVRIADVTSKIVKSKGSAQGTWHMEKGQLIFTVVQSDIPEVWEKNATRFFQVLELSDALMQLKEENGRVAEWKKTISGKGSSSEAPAQTELPMKPIAVNLNKIRSSTQDRFLCLSMKLIIKELMPDQKPPAIHPRVRDAAILFFSSLIYEDVKNFDQIQRQKDKLVALLNPYMEGMIKDIKIEHVIISTTMDKVREFIIEHTLTPEPPEGQTEDQPEGQADQKKS